MFICRNRQERRPLACTWSRLPAGPEMHLRTHGGAEGLGGLLQPPRGRGRGRHARSPSHASTGLLHHTRIRAPQRAAAVPGPRPASHKMGPRWRERATCTHGTAVLGAFRRDEPQKLTLNTQALTHTLTHTLTCSRTHVYTKHTHAHAHSCTCSHIHTLTRLMHSHTHAHTRTLNAHACTLMLTLTLMLNAHTHAHAHTLILTLAHSHSRAHAHTRALNTNTHAHTCTLKETGQRKSRRGYKSLEKSWPFR